MTSIDALAEIGAHTGLITSAKKEAENDGIIIITG